MIIGAAGGVGHFALQIANYLGAETTAIASFRHEEFIMDMKPAKFIDYTKTDYKKLNERFSSILDAAGTESFLTVNHLLEENGIYISLLPRPKILLHKLISLFTHGKEVKTFLMKSDYKDLEFINTMINEGKLFPRIDRVFGLQEINKAHQYSEEGHTEGKIVINITPQG